MSVACSFDSRAVGDFAGAHVVCSNFTDNKKFISDALHVVGNLEHFVGSFGKSGPGAALQAKLG